MLSRNAKVNYGDGQLDILMRKADVGDWFVLFLLSKNLDSTLFKEFIGQLTEKPAKDKFKVQNDDQYIDVDELIANQEQAEKEEYDDNPVTPQKLPVEESCIAAKQIRDLGLSFIDKRDLYSTVQSPRKDEPSLWALPHASDPFKMSGPAAPIASTSDYSLMLNDKAMKYLSDEQLVQMAANSPLNQSNSSSLTSRTPVNLTRYGMPENNMSLGTEKFLENYHLRQSRPM